MILVVSQKVIKGDSRAWSNDSTLEQKSTDLSSRERHEFHTSVTNVTLDGDVQIDTKIGKI